MNIEKLTKEECQTLISNNEFSKKIISSAKYVAIVLTQSWCSQWIMMKNYLDKMPDSNELKVYWIEYDLEDFKDLLMEYKENKLGSEEIPYVRYYKDGNFVTWSHYKDSGAFLRTLKA